MLGILYPVHTEHRGMDILRPHSEGNSGTQQRPTVWWRGRIALCSQKSWSLSPLKWRKYILKKRYCKMFCFSSMYISKQETVLTSHHINHALQNGHPQSAASLMQRWHGGPVLVEGVEALHAAQRPAVAPAAALQAGVTSCRHEDFHEVSKLHSSSFHQNLHLERRGKVMNVTENLWHKGIFWLSVWASSWPAGVDCTAYFLWETLRLQCTPSAESAVPPAGWSR